MALRRTARADPHRHERIQREAQRRPADRLAPGLCRLRRGRTAHRGGTPPALCRDPVRRDRESAPRGLQLDAADLRRGAPHRRFWPQGGLPQHDHHHDLERRVAQRGQEIGAGRLQHRVEERHGLRNAPVRIPQGSRADLRPGVTEPDRRHRIVPHAGTERCGAYHRAGVAGALRTHAPPGLQGEDHRRRQTPPGGHGLRIALRSPLAQAYADGQCRGTAFDADHRRQTPRRRHGRRRIGQIARRKTARGMTRNLSFEKGRK